MWGKILGCLFGYMLTGNFIGGLIGLFIGQQFDNVMRRGFYSGNVNFGRQFNQKELQADFFFATFATMGQVAKAKGRVTQDEIRVASAIMAQMGLSEQMRQEAQEAFRKGRDSQFSLDETLLKLRDQLNGRNDLIRFFLEMQIQAAFADGEIHPAERQILHQIASVLGFSSAHLEQRLRMQEGAFNFRQQGFGSSEQWQTQQNGNSLAEAYKILGAKETATPKELKRAHRKLMNEHHPDKLISKGLPPEMQEVAKQKAQEIQAAYDLIRKNRGFK